MTATRQGNRGWRIVFWVSAAIGAAALGVLGVLGFGYWSGQNTYDDIAQRAFADGDGQSFAVSWDELRAINPDVCGWIIVPGTNINYPIAHRAGDDEYYLDHDFSGGYSSIGPTYGCIMLSGDNNPNWSDQVNLCYGHNMANGTMFAEFNTFTDNAVFNAHRTIYLLTPEANYELETFALDHVLGTDTSVAVQNFSDEEALTAYVTARMHDSVVTPNPPAPAANTIKKVFAFSTCDADNRWRNIVFASIKATLN